MKKLLLIICIYITGCTTEEKAFIISQAIQNQTNSPVKVLFYNPSGTLISMVSISPGEVYDCEFRSVNNEPKIYGCTDIDTSFVRTIEFVFENDKGYRCSSDIPNSLCISGQDSGRLRIKEEDFELRNSKYYFVITQQDFDNAFDLP